MVTGIFGVRILCKYGRTKWKENNGVYTKSVARK